MSETGEMIRRLALEAGSARASGGFTAPLLAAALAALLLALGVILLAFGGTFSLSQPLALAPFWCKAGLLLLLAAGAFCTVRHHAVPGSSGFALLALLPGLAMPLLYVVFDPYQEPLLGNDANAVPVCFFAILLAALPALAVVLFAMKRAVVTRPAAAGAAAGLLAGAIGAAAYAVACRNNGALFFLIWYGLSIGVITLLGAVAGRRYLRW